MWISIRVVQAEPWDTGATHDRPLQWDELEAGEYLTCVQCRGFSRPFIPKEEMMADTVYAWPSPMATLRVGMR